MTENEQCNGGGTRYLIQVSNAMDSQHSISQALQNPFTGFEKMGISPKDDDGDLRSFHGPLQEGAGLIL